MAEFFGHSASHLTRQMKGELSSAPKNGSAFLIRRPGDSPHNTFLLPSDSVFNHDTGINKTGHVPGETHGEDDQRRSARWNKRSTKKQVEIINLLVETLRFHFCSEVKICRRIFGIKVKCCSWLCTDWYHGYVSTYFNRDKLRESYVAPANFSDWLN